MIFASALRELHSIATYCCLRARLKPEFSSTVRVTYAGSLPAEGEIASGGAVKLTKLAREFPEQGRRANLLYLVSSALPPAAVAWARAMKSAGGLVVLNQNGVAYPAWAPEKEVQRINQRNRLLLELSDFVFFQSRFCQASVEKWVGSRGTGFGILPNPVEVIFRSAETIPHTEPVLVVAGSHHHPVRVIRALEALGEMERRGVRCRLRIAGKLAWPGAREEIEKKAEALGVSRQVEFIGPYSQSELSKVFGGADVLLHLQDKDASPTVPLEAMSFGVGVVGPRSGALPELVPDRCGKLLPVQSGWDEFFLPGAQEIAAALTEILPKAADLRPECRAWVGEQFGLAKWLGAHAELFSRLLHGRKRRQPC